MPAPPTPGSSVATAAAPGATPAANVAGTAAADFLYLLAGMIGATPAAVPAPQASPLDPQAPLNLDSLPELLELNASDDSSSDDDSDTDSGESSSEDATALSVLALPVLPVPIATLPPVVDVSLSSTADEESRSVDSARSQAAAIPDLSDAMADVTAQLAAGTGSKDLPAVVPVAPADPTAATDDTASTASPPLSSTNSNSAANAAQLHSLAAAHALQDADNVPREIRAPLGTPAWTQELGDQLTWMAQHGREGASLRLSPEHLGPLEVRISMREGEASVWFGAAHADTRSALEQSLPRLRELFALQGLALADCGVFKEAPRQQSRSSVSNVNAIAMSDKDELASIAPLSAKRLGLIDTYA